MQLVIFTTDIVSLTIVVHGDVYSIQPYVIKFVCDLKQVIGFLNGILVSSTNRTDWHTMLATEIFLKLVF